MTAQADFGPLVVETDIDLAVIATLALWLPTYMAQVERERSLPNGFLMRPSKSSYRHTVSDDEEFLDGSLPAILVSTASTNGEPDMLGTGMVYADYRLTVSNVVRGRTPSETKIVAALFGGCVRRALLHHQSLDGFAADTRWIGSTPISVPDSTDEGRWLFAQRNDFVVSVDDVVQAGVGPNLPNDPYQDPDPDADPDAPYDPIAQVVDVILTVTGKSPGSP